MNLSRSFLVILTLSLFAGLNCATLFSSAKYNYRFESDPTNAKVSIRAKGRTLAELETPAEYVLNMKDSYQIHFELEGYESRSLDIDTALDGWAFANICNGGIGCIVDALTGAMKKPADEARLFWKFKRKNGATNILNPDEKPEYIIEVTLEGARGTLVAELDMKPGTGTRHANLAEIVRPQRLPLTGVGSE